MPWRAAAAWRRSRSSPMAGRGRCWPAMPPSRVPIWRSTKPGCGPSAPRCGPAARWIFMAAISARAAPGAPLSRRWRGEPVPSSPPPSTRPAQAPWAGTGTCRLPPGPRRQPPRWRHNTCGAMGICSATRPLPATPTSGSRSARRLRRSPPAPRSRRREMRFTHRSLPPCSTRARSAVMMVFILRPWAWSSTLHILRARALMTAAISATVSCCRMAVL